MKDSSLYKIGIQDMDFSMPNISMLPDLSIVEKLSINQHRKFPQGNQFYSSGISHHQCTISISQHIVRKFVSKHFHSTDKDTFMRKYYQRSESYFKYMIGNMYL